MNSITINYNMKYIKKNLYQATAGSSGFDLSADIASNHIIAPNTLAKLSTGIYLELSKGIEAQIRSRSGLAYHSSIFVLNAPGTIDSDYTGEVQVLLYNLGNKEFVISPGAKIAQMVFTNIIIPNDSNITLSNYIRKDSGFGSSGL